MPAFLPHFQSGLLTGHNNNHTLVPRGKVATGPNGLGYPYSAPQRSKIGGLPGGLRYASAAVPEFPDSFMIEADDPNADGFVGRLAGGGRRSDIFGNK